MLSSKGKPPEEKPKPGEQTAVKEQLKAKGMPALVANAIFGLNDTWQDSAEKVIAWCRTLPKGSK